MFGRSDSGAGRGVNVMRTSQANNLSFIGPEVIVTGNIGGSGNLHIDGRVDGDVTAASVILGTDGIVHGNIVTDAAQIAGSVEGTIAAKSLVIEASARIVGDLSYDAVSIASGAQVEGRVKRLKRDDGEPRKLLAAE